MKAKELYSKLWASRPKAYKASGLACLLAGINWHIIVWGILNVSFIPETFWAINLAAFLFFLRFLYLAGAGNETRKFDFILTGLIFLSPSAIVSAILARKAFTSIPINIHNGLLSIGVTLLHLVQFFSLLVIFFPAKRK